MADSGEPRQFLEGETARSLIAQASGFTDVQGETFSIQYRGQWLQVTGTVVNVSANEYTDTLVSLDLGPFPNQASLYFTRGVRAPLMLTKGEKVTAQGQIFFVSGGGISLTNCEIVAVATQAELLLEEIKTAGCADPSLASEACESLHSGEDRNDDDKPLVDYDHLKLWFAVFTAAYPGQAAEKIALASARATFPKHFVPRQWVRDLRGPQDKGRPRKNNDK